MAVVPFAGCWVGEVYYCHSGLPEVPLPDGAVGALVCVSHIFLPVLLLLSLLDWDAYLDEVAVLLTLLEQW